MDYKTGYALVLDDGSGKYTMSTIHKTPECAIENGLGQPFGCLTDVRVVAVVPVTFADDGKVNLHMVFGDQDLIAKEVARLNAV